MPNAINKIHRPLSSWKEILTRHSDAPHIIFTRYDRRFSLFNSLVFAIESYLQFFFTIFFFLFFIDLDQTQNSGKEQIGFFFCSWNVVGQNAWWALMGTMFRSSIWLLAPIQRDPCERLYARFHGSNSTKLCVCVCKWLVSNRQRWSLEGLKSNENNN